MGAEQIPAGAAAENQPARAVALARLVKRLLSCLDYDMGTIAAIAEDPLGEGQPGSTIFDGYDAILEVAERWLP